MNKLLWVAVGVCLLLLAGVVFMVGTGRISFWPNSAYINRTITIPLDGSIIAIDGSLITLQLASSTAIETVNTDERVKIRPFLLTSQTASEILPFDVLKVGSYITIPYVEVAGGRITALGIRIRTATTTTSQ